MHDAVISEGLGRIHERKPFDIVEPFAAQLTELARHAPLALAGAGARPQLATAVQARLLGGDPVTAAASGHRG